MRTRIKLRCFVLGMALALLAPGMATAASLHLDSDPIDEIVIREALVIGSVGGYGRWPVHRDAIQAQIARGDWTPPTEGDVLTLADGRERVWTRVEADDHGRFAMGRERGGYLFF